jgi:hypothetical protein
MAQPHTARRDLIAMFAYLAAVGVVVAGLALGVYSIIPPLPAELVAKEEPPETQGSGSRVEQWKASREAIRQAVTPPVVEAEPQPAATKPVPTGPAYGTMAKKKAQAELAAGKHKKRPAKQPAALSREAMESMGYAPQPPRRSYNPFDHAPN